MLLISLSLHTIIINAFLLLIQLSSFLDAALIWSDEFNGDSLDNSKWNYYTGKTSHHELEKYTHRDVNVFLENGNLVLQALKENYKGHNFTSGRVNTKSKGEFLYCIIKVRAKLPFGRGLWPAIWLLPSYYTHGHSIASGEIDIMELLGHKPSEIYSTIHFGKVWTDRSKNSTKYSLSHGNFSDNFHEFAMDWKQNQIEFSVDGIKFMTFTPLDVPRKYTYPFDDYFYLTLNVAVGGDWPKSPDKTTKFPQRMEIDYVRVYNY